MTETIVPNKKYVVGFAFSADKSKVVLIRKNRPAWQAGKLNGVGGKIEPDDADGNAAMCREFEEETGVVTQTHEWRHYLTINGEMGYVLAYFAVGDHLLEATTNSDEAVEIIAVDYSLVEREAIANLHWFIAIALDKDQPNLFVNVDYQPAMAHGRGV
jgi:8-oxo-dGTP diphosphatase